MELTITEKKVIEFVKNFKGTVNCSTTFNLLYKYYKQINNSIITKNHFTSIVRKNNLLINLYGEYNGKLKS